MRTTVDRRTVDLGGYPDLVVIYLGMRVNAATGLKTLAGFGPRISSSVAAKPEGLLLHENLIFSLFPPHVGARRAGVTSGQRSDDGPVGTTAPGGSSSFATPAAPLLARDVFHARRHGSGVRRSAESRLAF
jgi:hypothetical protein